MRRGRAAVESARAGRPEGGVGGGRPLGCSARPVGSRCVAAVAGGCVFQDSCALLPRNEAGGGRGGGEAGGWTLGIAGGGGLSRACGLLRVRDCGDRVLRRSYSAPREGEACQLFSSGVVIHKEENAKLAAPTKQKLVPVFPL